VSEVLAERTVAPTLRQEMVVDLNWLWGEAGIPVQLVGQLQRSLVEGLQSYFRATLAYRKDSSGYQLHSLHHWSQKGSHCHLLVAGTRSSLCFSVIGLVGVPFLSIERAQSAGWQFAH
jgi:hypothetical protein